MGRFLANGVMTRFEIAKKDTSYSDEKFNLEKEMNNILKEINKTIDTSLYEITSKSKGHWIFSLKPEIFNKNIHDLIRELCPLTCPNVNSFIYIYREIKEKKIDIQSKKFEENYPINCKVDSEGNYYVKVNEEEQAENFTTLYWILNDRRLFYNVKIGSTVILLWSDEDKYIGEDETWMLKIINNMKTKYYNSLLSKALIYLVE